MNLLNETLNILKENGKTPADVRWVGRESANAKCSWDDFAKQANFEYDNGYGIAEMPGDLIVAGDDWWLERAGYDGSGGNVVKITVEFPAEVKEWAASY